MELRIIALSFVAVMTAFGKINHNGGLDVDAFIQQFTANVTPPMNNPAANNLQQIEIDGNGNVIVGVVDPQDGNFNPLNPIDDPQNVISGLDHNLSVPVPETITPTYNGGGDNDNDVPTLLMINSTLRYLNQEVTQQKVLEQLKALQGDLLDGNGSPTGEKATLADIVRAIKGEDRNDTLNRDNASTEQQMEELELAYTDNLNSDKGTIPTKAASFGKFNWNVSTTPNNETQFDLMDMTASLGSGLNIPTVEEAGVWIKRVIVAIAFFIYFMATYNMGIETIKLLTYSSESNPVSNYAVLGNSAGTAVIMAGKITVIVAMIGFIAVALATSISDCNINFDGASYTYGSVTNVAMATIGGSDVHEGFRMSVHYLDVLLPIDSILQMSIQYLIQRMGIFIGLLTFNRALRLAS